jgi:hypothetical protein
MVRLAQVRIRVAATGWLPHCEGMTDVTCDLAARELAVGERSAQWLREQLADPRTPEHVLLNLPAGGRPTSPRRRWSSVRRAAPGWPVMPTATPLATAVSRADEVRAFPAAVLHRDGPRARTPLTVIVGGAELLLDEFLELGQADLARRCAQPAHRREPPERRRRRAARARPTAADGARREQSWRTSGRPPTTRRTAWSRWPRTPASSSTSTSPRSVRAAVAPTLLRQIFSSSPTTPSCIAATAER